jgi:hypothetical protein
MTTTLLTFFILFIIIVCLFILNNHLSNKNFELENKIISLECDIQKIKTKNNVNIDLLKEDSEHLIWIYAELKQKFETRDYNKNSLT